MLNNLLEIGRSQSGCFVCSHFQPAKSVFQTMKDALEIMTGPLAEEIGKYQAEKDAIELLSQNGIFLDISSQAANIEMFQDEIKFCQIVGNLLKNALHHRRSRVEIKMAVEDKDLVLLVSDDGPGVEPEHQELIFKRYAQVQECSIVPRKGHGLGLAGALILARCLGGDIKIESQKGQGRHILFDVAAEAGKWYGVIFIRNRKPGPQGQVRDDRLCHRSSLFLVSGVRFQVSVKIES